MWMIQRLLVAVALLIFTSTAAAIDDLDALNFHIEEQRLLQEAQTPSVEVRYEFQLDVNPSGSFPNVEDGVAELEQNVLDNLNAFIAQASNPPVSIEGISSTIKDDICEPMSQGWNCAIVETTVQVLILNDEGADLVEKATLERVQVYMNQFNSRNQGNIAVQFIGPFIVFTEVIVELSPVDGEMDDTEIAIFEGALYDILQPALENGDPPITLETAEFLYQDLLELSINRRHLQGGGTGRLFRNQAHVYVTGRCRGCTNDDMDRLVNDAVDENVQQFRNELQQEGPENDTDYFDDLDDIKAVPATAPATPKPIDDTLYTGGSVNDDKEQPFWIWILLAAALAVLGVAFALLIYRKRQQKKEHPGGMPYYGDSSPGVNHHNTAFGRDDTPIEEHSMEEEEESGHEVVDNPNYVAKKSVEQRRYSAGKYGEDYETNNNAYDHDENVFTQPKQMEEPDNVFQMP